MTLEQAFERLIANWENQPHEFRHKYRYYKSKHLSGIERIGDKKKREMLLWAGYKENWDEK